VRRVFVAAVAALSLAAGPAYAQSAAIPKEAEANLRCAVWAGVILGNNRDNAEVAAGFGMALGWFTALYEGMTGKPFEQAITAAYINSVMPEIEAIEVDCKVRMQNMGQRFSDWGETLQQSGQ
jgi:hypothetical protein